MLKAAFVWSKTVQSLSYKPVRQYIKPRVFNNSTCSQFLFWDFYGVKEKVKKN